MTDEISVLVVEDEAIVLIDIVFQLQQVGLKVYEATNADAAVKLLEQHDDIRVLFTDIDMPGSMDGLKLAAAVCDRWPPVKIMVTSGRPLGYLDIIPEGAIFMAKPYGYEVLTRAVTRLAASYRHST